MSGRKAKQDRAGASAGLLVPCGLCGAPKRLGCVVRGTSRPADLTHAVRIADGRKWAAWHRGMSSEVTPDMVVDD